MKRFTLFCALWLLAMCFMLWGAWAQNTTEYRQPGDTLLQMALENATNHVADTRTMVVERATDWLTVAKDWAAGALLIITSLLGWLAKNKTNQASVSGVINRVLIQEIQKFATKQEKDNIASAARLNGVSDDLHDAVKANTPSAPQTEPFDYRASLPTTPAAKEEIKPI